MMILHSRTSRLPPYPPHQEEIAALLDDTVTNTAIRRSLTNSSSPRPLKRKPSDSLPMASSLGTDTTLPPVAPVSLAEWPASNVTSLPDAHISVPAQPPSFQHLAALVTPPPTARKLDLDHPVLDTKPSPPAPTDVPASSAADLPFHHKERIRHLAGLVSTPFRFQQQDSRVDEAIWHAQAEYRTHLKELGEDIAKETAKHEERIAKEMASHRGKVAAITGRAEAKFGRNLDGLILPLLKGVSVRPPALPRSLSQ